MEVKFECKTIPDLPVYLERVILKKKSNASVLDCNRLYPTNNILHNIEFARYNSKWNEIIYDNSFDYRIRING